MLVPEVEHSLTAGHVEMPPQEKESNILSAIARSTIDGLHLALNVGAMLITFLATACLGKRDDGTTRVPNRLPIVAASCQRIAISHATGANTQPKTCSGL